MNFKEVLTDFVVVLIAVIVANYVSKKFLGM
jgi:hypothetical protein